MSEESAASRWVEIGAGALRTKVHYVEHGPADGTPVVLLHGFMVDHHIMSAAFEPVFAEREGWRRIYLDLPGMGATRAPAALHGTQQVFELVDAAIEELLGDQRHVLAGQSYGGLLARGLTAARPDRVDGLALSCPILEPVRTRRDLPPHRVLHRDPALAVTVGADVLDQDEINVIQDQHTWQRTVDDILPALALADEEALARIAGPGEVDYAGAFPTEGAAPFEAPTLFFLGRQDSSTGYRDVWPLLEHYPHASLAVVDRGGHAAHVEQQGLFEGLAGEWLDRVERHRAGADRRP